jgi:aconitate hydratase
VKQGARYADGTVIPVREPDYAARDKTIAYSILRAHDESDDFGKMRIAFDALISHDITYVSIIQTARASGMTEFPIPYAMTNCHNSLCAVGGTINADDHAFGLSAAKKFGGVYVPANIAVIHQYARERMTRCGRMILGSDSHTRYGCYGTMGIGEGGGELVKQLLKNTYDISAPEVIAVYMRGKPRHGVGPHDVALALVAAVFGFAKNKILEFFGPGLTNLSADFRSGIDVMTTETTCLSSIWATDEVIQQYYHDIGRPEDFKKLSPENGAYYDAVVNIDLSKIECMIALPFHPSKALPINALKRDAKRIFEEIERETPGLDLKRNIKDNGIYFEQGVIVGCAGGMYENIAEAAAILDGRSVGMEFSVYPSSAPVSLAVTRSGLSELLALAGAVMKPAFCGPCFGAGDTPSHNSLSIRHATRNFPNREGGKPDEGQIASVALMDSRSIAATAANGGFLTAATDIEYTKPEINYHYEATIYEKLVYNGVGQPNPSENLRFGPNIKDWPKFNPLGENLLLRLCAVIRDEVTTTDELIPSGETSSYRSNPEKLSEFTLSRREPAYVKRSKAVRDMESARLAGEAPAELLDILSKINGDIKNTTVGSCVFAKKPGDGSAREQAASCQKTLGGLANICYEYATKRYRSNCINWGIIPFTISESTDFRYSAGDWIYVPDIKRGISEGIENFTAHVITSDGTVETITLECDELADNEKTILIDGCLMNYYAARRG